MSENLNRIIKQGVKPKKKYKDGEKKNVKVIRKFYGSAELKDIAEKFAVLTKHFTEFSGACLEELRKIQNLTNHIYDLNEKMDQIMIDRKLKRKIESGRAFDFDEDEHEEESWKLWKGITKD
ncbi:MAG TPA: hypothetical protein LFW20_01180 [Rickettsia endosymbiont of Omalisus fontisbellaquei]|nr:hypothetical protein [Rickettsia endosymbiont of Omalisus fontisbellaquei]